MERNLDSAILDLDRTTKTIVDDRGRIYLPINIRRRMGIKEGDQLLIDLVDNCLKIYTRSFRRSIERII